MTDILITLAVSVAAAFIGGAVWLVNDYRAWAKKRGTTNG
jgi:hypothetical protein